MEAKYKLIPTENGHVVTSSIAAKKGQGILWRPVRSDSDIKIASENGR